MSEPATTNESGTTGRGRGKGRGGGGRRWKSMGRGASNWRGRGRGGGRGGSAQDAEGDGSARARAPPPPRPTHFLALPLHNHSTLRTKVSAFQNALLAHDPPIAGLHESIVISPMRLHLTLGVMHLDESPSSTSSPRGSASSQSPYPASPLEEHRTISTAMSLLSSLRAQIASILEGRPTVKVTLNALHALKTDKRKDGTGVDAGVLYLAPDEASEDGRRLRQVADLVHRAFKSYGYIVENRPLTLHCTILNTSHRRPRNPRLPFSYTDILNSQACSLIKAVEESGAGVEEVTSQLAHTSLSAADPALQTTELCPPLIIVQPPPIYVYPNPTGSQSPIDPPPALNEILPGDSTTSPPPSSKSKPTRAPIPKPLPITMGTYDVRTVELWRMGSWAPDGAYVSEGAVRLGGQ